MLNKSKLDEMTANGCGNPECQDKDCKVLYLHGACHITGRIEVSYRNGSGVLRVGCMECGKAIAQVEVKDGI